MSVEIQGIKGYEYQYLATVYMALQYLSEDMVNIYVEAEEDAKIIYGDPKMRKERFIQVRESAWRYCARSIKTDGRI